MNEIHNTFSHEWNSKRNGLTKGPTRSPDFTKIDWLRKILIFKVQGDNYKYFKVL